MSVASTSKHTPHQIYFQRYVKTNRENNRLALCMAEISKQASENLQISKL